MRNRSWIAAFISVLAAVTLIGIACGSSSSSGSPIKTTTSTSAPGTGVAGERDILPPAPHTKPVYGGELKIVGSGDVDHLDTCCAYYTTTYEVLRAVSRQLVSYASLRSTPAPTAVVPDMATFSISPNGLVYTFRIKSGVMWDAPSGPRQVTSSDEVLGLKRLCNPVSPAPPLSYWEGNIAGMTAFCTGFQKMKLPTSPSAEIAAIKTYIDTHQISGLATPNPLTLEITLLHPASNFINIMAMPMSSPTPVEILNYLPASVQEEEHFISDGPYTITRYTPGVGFTLVRNPYWKQSTDSLRYQYVDGITIKEGENPTIIQQQLETGTADLEWDTTVPTAEVQSLSSSPQYVQGFVGGIYYLVFNMDSRASGGALQKAAVRQALQYCVNKRHIVQESGGPGVNVASNQILPPQITGFRSINPYPSANDEGNPGKCRAMLKKAGYPNGIKLTLVYPNNVPFSEQAVALQADFAAGGVTVSFNEQPSEGGYFDYIETPSNKAHWDLAIGLWFPDWDGNGAQSFFGPLLDGALYGTGSTDYGDYNDPTVNSGINAALQAPTVAAASKDWAGLDDYIMTKNPAWVPLVYIAEPDFIGKNVVGAVFNGFLGYVDITTLWLKNG
jgi:peptide/nickel transport system substrate-binding protein